MKNVVKYLPLLLLFNSCSLKSYQFYKPIRCILADKNFACTDPKKNENETGYYFPVTFETAENTNMIFITSDDYLKGFDNVRRLSILFDECRLDKNFRYNDIYKLEFPNLYGFENGYGFICSDGEYCDRTVENGYDMIGTTKNEYGKSRDDIKNLKKEFEICTIKRKNNMDYKYEVKNEFRL